MVQKDMPNWFNVSIHFCQKMLIQFVQLISSHVIVGANATSNNDNKHHHVCIAQSQIILE